MADRSFGALKARIADEMNRTDLTDQINLAVLDAISYYEDERFFFNESRSLTFTLSSSQEFYTEADLAAIPNLVEIDAITVTVNANRYQLKQRTYDYLERISMGNQYTSLPTDFSYYAQQIRVYPIPNQAIETRISAVVKFDTLSASADTNAWTTSAEALIRARAKAYLYLNVTRDAQAAMEMQQFEQQEFQNLMDATDKKVSTGRVVPSQF